MTKYRALAGINYPGKSGEKRAEAGELVSDLPTKSVKWLLDGGYIEPVSFATGGLIEDAPVEDEETGL